MPYIIWDGSMSIGHEAIDADHRELVSCLNKLHDASGSPSEEIELIFDALAQYTIEHFGREEELMQQTDYPDIKVHEKEHDLLIELLEQHKNSYFSGNERKEDVLHFLKLWLVGHVKGCDLKLSEHLKTIDSV